MTCHRCGGSGVSHATAHPLCRTCNGHGRVYVGGLVSTSLVCPACAGIRLYPLYKLPPCPVCDGTGDAATGYRRRALAWLRSART